MNDPFSISYAYPDNLSITYDDFEARPYQQPIINALFKHKYKRLLCIMPRRSGKDVVALHIIGQAAMQRVGVYYYLLPTLGQCRKVAWQGLSNDGTPLIDLIPRQLIRSKHEMDMRLHMINGSIIQFVGSDNFERIIGTNPVGMIWSEYAISDYHSYAFMRPVLTANDGWAMFISTPRGRNHMWSMYQVAKESPEWFCYHKTVEDTQHISIEKIHQEIALGEMSEELARQEYWCDFSRGVSGAFYSAYIDKLRTNEQIGFVPWEPSHEVYSAWDIGVRDATSIIMFQCIGATIRIIDVYENTQEGLEHYIRVLDKKPYKWGKHFGPHDLRVKEFGSGSTRLAKATDLGLDFTIVDRQPIADGIEIARTVLPRCWFNEATTKPLIRALENYRQEYDERKETYTGKIIHDKFSHFADAFRYMATGLKYATRDSTPEDIERRYQEATYGRYGTEAYSPGVYKQRITNLDYY